MSESAIADFSAEFTFADQQGSDPVSGRVIMSPKRLILASGSGQEVIPLSNIFDIRVGHVPGNLPRFFDDTITIAYNRNEESNTVLIEADDPTIERFCSILFRATLNGSRVVIQHPARIGGRVTDAVAEKASLEVAPGTLRVTGIEPPIDIDLSIVIYFETSERTIAGETRSVLTVRHMQDGRSMLTYLWIQSSRKMNVLGRYLRLEYSRALADLNDVSIGKDEMKVLVGIYSGGTETDLEKLIGTEKTRISNLLTSLEEKGLIIIGAEETNLTSKGRMVVGKRIDRLNG